MDGRLPTEVYYESDSGEINNKKIDLLNDNLSENRSQSVHKRDRKKLQVQKQGSGSINDRGQGRTRVRGMTPPAIRRSSDTAKLQPFMSTANLRESITKAKIDAKFEGAFSKLNKKKQKKKK